MKLEVGMYVRTEYGKIYKVLSVEEPKYNIGGAGFIYYGYLSDGNGKIDFTFYKNNKMAIYREKEEIKASHNIIDLIEIGDYVNGLKVYEVRNDIKGFGVVVFSDCSIHEWQIKSIVTKEMYSSVEYRVETN